MNIWMINLPNTELLKISDDKIIFILYGSENALVYLLSHIQNLMQFYMVRIGYIDKNFLKEKQFCPKKFQENLGEKDSFYFESVCENKRKLFKVVLKDRALYLDYKTSLYFDKYYKVCGKNAILELDTKTMHLNYLMINGPIDEQQNLIDLKAIGFDTI